jgi:hypothetical protein
MSDESCSEKSFTENVEDDPEEDVHRSVSRDNLKTSDGSNDGRSVEMIDTVDSRSAVHDEADMMASVITRDYDYDENRSNTSDRSLSRSGHIEYASNGTVGSRRSSYNKFTIDDIGSCNQQSRSEDHEVQVIDNDQDDGFEYYGGDAATDHEESPRDDDEHRKSSLAPLGESTAINITCCDNGIEVSESRRSQKISLEISESVVRYAENTPLGTPHGGDGTSSPQCGSEYSYGSSFNGNNNASAHIPTTTTATVITADNVEQQQLRQQQLNSVVSVNHQPSDFGKLHSFPASQHPDFSLLLTLASQPLVTEINTTVKRESFSIPRFKTQLRKCCLNPLSGVISGEEEKEMKKNGIAPSQQLNSEIIGSCAYSSKVEEESHGGLQQLRGQCSSDCIGPTGRHPIIQNSRQNGKATTALLTLPVSQSCRSAYALYCHHYRVHINSQLLHSLSDAINEFHLKSMRVTDNYVGFKGVLPLLDVCRINTNLCELVLSNNGLCNCAINQLVHMAEHHPSLRCIDLSRNPFITMRSLRILRTLLIQNANIAVLDLSGTHIAETHQKCLTRLIANRNI